MAVLVLPQIFAAVTEARLLLWAEAGNARRWIAGAHAALAGAWVLAALSRSAWTLGLAMAIVAPCSGIACALAQGTLVEARPAERERAALRWGLAGSLGDLAGPFLVAALSACGVRWRGVCLATAAAFAAHALAILPGPALTMRAPADDAAEGGLGDALRNRALVLWLLAAAACTLLDETFVLLAGSWLRARLGAGEAVAALALGAWAAGAAVGLVASERLLARASSRRMLGLSSAGCAALCLGWLALPTVTTAAAGLFAVGATAACLHPIATARAYAACPGRPALVGAAAQIVVPVELVLIAASGFAADSLGVGVALAAMVAQPVALGVMAWAWPTGRVRRRPRPGGARAR